MTEKRKIDVLEPLKSASDEIKKIIKSVLELEKDKLYQKRPHITSDIINIIKEVIK